MTNPALTRTRSGPHVTLDTRGGLAVGALDETGHLDGTTPSATQPMLPVSQPGGYYRPTTLDGIISAQQIGTGTGVPTGALTAGMVSRVLAAGEAPSWTTLCQLSLSGAAGGVIGVAATAHLSGVVASGGDAVDRQVMIRLVCRGAAYGETTVTLSADDTTGTAQSYAFPATTWRLPAGPAIHDLRIEWKPLVSTVTLYSSGSTITVTDGTPAGGGLDLTGYVAGDVPKSTGTGGPTAPFALDAALAGKEATGVAATAVAAEATARAAADAAKLDASHTQAVSLEVLIDGGGYTIQTGVKALVEVPVAMTLTGARLVGDASGSLVLSVKKAAYAGLPTTASIVASAPPTLASAQKSQDTTLAGWTTALSAGDWLEVGVTSCSGINRATLSLSMTRVV